MKKGLITLSLILTGFYLTSAINFNLSSGNKLDISNWQEINNITTKINLNNNNLNINGKLVISGKICLNNGKCLGECETGYHWDTASASCEMPVSGISCQDILSNDSGAISGIYLIDPNGGDESDAFEVYCDMDLNGGGWTLIYSSTENTAGNEFKGTGSCKAINNLCTYAVNPTLVDNSSQVLFYTDETYWARLSYINSGRWALSMKDINGRDTGYSPVNPGLTLIDKGSSISRDSYWSSYWDNDTGIIFSNSSHYGVLAISYGIYNNGWLPENPTTGNINNKGNTHNINIFIR